MASDLHLWQLFLVQVGTALAVGYISFRQPTMKKALLFSVIASFVASFVLGFIFGFGNGFIAGMKG